MARDQRGANQFIPTEKQDSKYSYKKAFGYFPGIAQVDGMPFYIEGRDGWLARLPFEAFFPERGYSLVVQRTLCDGQTDLLDGQYVYRCILTNDKGLSLRANNDFGWACLPCSSMKANTVFMILTAFIHNFYRYFLGLVANASALRGSQNLVPSRVKRFVFSFVSVPFKWVKCGARKMLRLYTNNDAYLRLQV